MRRMGAMFLAASLCVAGCGDDAAPADSGERDTGANDSGERDTGANDSGERDTGADAAPVRCGGLGGATCGPTAYCDYPEDSCGADDGTGVCQPRPEACPDVYRPVCGCDGTVHSNECDARAAGVDLNALGGCTPPPGTSRCGYRFCDAGSYCLVTLDDTGLPPVYECEAAPAGCPATGPTCACVAEVPCGDFCREDADGRVTVTCPAG